MFTHTNYGVFPTAHVIRYRDVANTLIFIGFTGPMAWVVQRLVPERPAKGPKEIQPKYLDDILLETPSLALDRVRMELRRLGERAYDMVCKVLPVALRGSKEDLMNLAKRDDEVDVLYGHIVTYLGDLTQQNLQARQSKQLYDYMIAVNNIENIADLIETNIVEAGLARLRGHVHYLKRVYYFAKRIAKAVAEEALVQEAAHAPEEATV